MVSHVAERKCDDGRIAICDLLGATDLAVMHDLAIHRPLIRTIPPRLGVKLGADVQGSREAKVVGPTPKTIDLEQHRVQAKVDCVSLIVALKVGSNPSKIGITLAPKELSIPPSPSVLTDASRAPSSGWQCCVVAEVDLMPSRSYPNCFHAFGSEAPLRSLSPRNRRLMANTTESPSAASPVSGAEGGRRQSEQPPWPPLLDASSLSEPPHENRTTPATIAGRSRHCSFETWSMALLCTLRWGRARNSLSRAWRRDTEERQTSRSCEPLAAD